MVRLRVMVRVSLLLGLASHVEVLQLSMSMSECPILT